MDNSSNNNENQIMMVSTIENLKRELDLLRETSDEEYAIAVAMAARDRKQLERQVTLSTRERDNALRMLQRQNNTRKNDSHEVEELRTQISELTQERDDAMLALKINQSIVFTNSHRALGSDDNEDDDDHCNAEEEIEELKYQIYKLKEERDDVIELHKMEQRHVKDLRVELITLQIQIQEAQDSCATYKSKFEQAQSQYEQAQNQLEQIFLPLHDVDTQLDQLLDDIRHSDHECKPKDEEDENEETEYESCSDFDDACCGFIYDDEEKVNNANSKSAAPTILSNQDIFVYKHSSCSEEEDDDEEEAATVCTVDTVEEEELKRKNDDNHRAFDQVLSSLSSFFNDIVGGEDRRDDDDENMKEFTEQPVNGATQKFHDAILEAANRQKHKPSSIVVAEQEERQDGDITDDDAQRDMEEERVVEEENTTSATAPEEKASQLSSAEDSSVAESIDEEHSDEEEEQDEGSTFCSEIEIFEDEDEPASKEFFEQPRPKGAISQDAMVAETIHHRDDSDKFYTPPSSPLKEFGEVTHVGSLQWQLLEKQTRPNWIHGLFHELPLTRTVI